MKLNSQLNIIKTPQERCGGENSQLTVTTFEVDHEISQGFNAFQRHRVIDRGTHTAYHTVTFQRMQTRREGLFQNTLSRLLSASWNGTFMRERLVLATSLR